MKCCTDKQGFQLCLLLFSSSPKPEVGPRTVQGNFLFMFWYIICWIFIKKLK